MQRHSLRTVSHTTVRAARHLRRWLACAGLGCMGACLGCTQASAQVVSHIKVLSDHVEDVSSLDAWKQSFIRPGMTDRQKAIAVWESVVKFRHQESPPKEYLEGEAHPHDPIKCFNVYGYGQCCCASANVEALACYAGLDARGWAITAHSVPEIRIGDHWSMFDASLINYFQKPDGSIASVDEINRSILDFFAARPQVKNERGFLYKYMLRGGWRNGPAILAGGTGYDENGYLPAATHAWADSIAEFGGRKNFVYEYGTALGYEVNIQLRAGEKLVRNWSNKGLQVNALEGGDCSTLRESPADRSGQFRYAPRFGDHAPGRIGNGTLEYDLPLAGGRYRPGMLDVENIVDTDGGIRVQDAGKPGTLTFRMPCSYVYLSGQLAFTGAVGPGGSIVVRFSDNNGLDWKEIVNVTRPGARAIDLKPLVNRRYDYRLRFTLRGKGTGLDAVTVTHDIQHSQRPLPILMQGENRIRFSAGPQEGTITVQGNLDPQAAKGKNLVFADYHPTLDGIDPSLLRVKGGQGTATIPIATPGDMTRLRIGAHYRARDARDGWTIEASFDDGATFLPVGRLAGPTPGHSDYFVFDRVPAHARKALVRLTGTQRNTTCMFDLRVDADYAEPHGVFVPVKVTYAWSEGGQAKSNTFIASAPQQIYTIQCAGTPLMKSLTLELAE